MPIPIPDFQSTMRPLLAELADGQVHDFNELYPKVVKFFIEGLSMRRLFLAPGDHGFDQVLVLQLAHHGHAGQVDNDAGLQ